MIADVTAIEHRLQLPDPLEAAALPTARSLSAEKKASSTVSLLESSCM